MPDSLGTTTAYSEVLFSVSVKCSYVSPVSISARVDLVCTEDVVNNKRRIISQSSLTTLVTQAVAELKCN